MPGEEAYIKKQQLQQLEEHNWNPQVQEENVYAAAMFDRKRENSELQASRFKFWGVTYKDGAAMTAVKQSLARVTEFMNETIPQEENAFQAQLAEIEGRYARFLDSCRHYIRTHPRPITKSGKDRLAMVRRLSGWAQKEQAQLRYAADHLRKTGQNDLIWGNLLGVVRGRDLNLDKADSVEQGGAGTSDVTIVSVGQSKLFFKDDEVVRPPSEEIQRKYIDGCQDKKDLAFYQKMKALMADEMIIETETGAVATSAQMFKSPQMIELLQSEREQDREFGCWMLLENLKIHDPKEWQGKKFDEREKEILSEMVPQYNKWLTRYQVCKTGCIEAGSLLSKRNVATSRMAQLMNVPELVAYSCVARCHGGGNPEVRHGVAMAQAKGNDCGKVINAARSQGKKVTYSPEGVRQLSQLQFFDCLCGQIDRNISNRFVTVDEAEDRVTITGVQGIDNDMCFGQLRYGDMNEMVSGIHMLPIFEKDGLCVLPALDGDMVSALFALNFEAVYYAMRDLLSNEEIDCLWERIEGMRAAITRSMELNPQLVVASDKWDREVAQRFSKALVNRSYVSEANIV